ncbi:MAG: AmmeMemoRadiSam system radical SAM enzyme [Candidatus Omnitrophica bacterium]|nr:AmmeMemoRadiSam system radical SAM enzyme [Candidatus Omnitrophota bacterium]
MKRLLTIILATFLIFSCGVQTYAAGGGEEAAKGRVASYWESLGNNIVHCGLCPRKCTIGPGTRGFCTARINIGGVLYTLGYGNPIAVHVDPIEKKPFFHVLPGTNAYSIAVAGCNMRCLFCQNWQISQAKPDEVTAYDMPPERIVANAKRGGCPFIVYTYTEPTIFYEYMLDISKLARKNGLRNGMHTCGYINPEPLKELLKYMDAVNVDLKSFDPEFYKKMGSMAELTPVLETIKAVKREGVWLELTNLIIPGQNDDPEQIRKMCEWIKENLGEEVPLHFSRFTPSFKLQNLPPTPVEKLEEAYKIAKDVGLKYVYIGNIPGHTYENTYCPKCKKIAVARIGYEVLENSIVDGRCKSCGEKIAGIWK